MGDEAGVGLGSVDAVLREVQSEAVCREAEGSGGEEERVSDGCGVARRGGQEMVCEKRHVGVR